MFSSKIDTHCHTTESDGAQSKELVFQESKKQKISIFAITDHDMVTRIPWVKSGLQNDGQLLLEWVEISARYEYDGYKKSLHLPLYALNISGEVEDILQGIREGKGEKIRRQCEQLRRHGCKIVWVDGQIEDWSFEGVQRVFPDTRAKWLNNWHLVKLLIRYPENMKILEHIAPGITSENLMQEGFKSEGKWTKLISLPERPREYEPRIEELIEVIDPSRMILSLAHANFTFRTRDEFTSHIHRILSLGINALEINSRANQVWTNLIRETQVQSGRDLFLTFWSDCHDLTPKSHDSQHSLLGDTNPHIWDDILHREWEKIRDFFLTH